MMSGLSTKMVIVQNFAIKAERSAIFISFTSNQCRISDLELGNEFWN